MKEENDRERSEIKRVSLIPPLYARTKYNIKKNLHNRESILFKDTLTLKRSLVSINYFVNFYSTNRNFQFIEDEKAQRANSASRDKVSVRR